ncbi:hypothetical protein [Streptomyces alboflavus]|uniref:hypothetical protein n=1 Tax=Streptomyces alboflavus TaxID=67267 RepID=UPI000F658459|nr:hypothetical protein [Streptomyces alboflavus]
MSTNPTPEGTDGADPFADIDDLIGDAVTLEDIGAGVQAAAERRGITVAQLLDRMARAGRVLGPPELEPPAAVPYDEAEAARLLAPPPWAGSHLRPGHGGDPAAQTNPETER